nr:MAG TPA: Septum formation initiator [Caudoviricetes sp.]
MNRFKYIALIICLGFVIVIGCLEFNSLKNLNNKQLKEITALKKEIAQKNREVDSLKNIIDIETDNTKTYIKYIDSLREDKRKLLEDYRYNNNE